jgi:hypothetical protein
VPPAPLLARELNLRTEAIVERVLDGYDPEVETPLPAPSAPAMRRLAVRFLRILTAGLESGRPGVSMGRAELAGLRGGLQGTPGLGVLAEHTRVAIAIAMEAEEARRQNVAMEPQAMASLYAVIDYAQAAVARGFEQAQGDAAPPPAPA